MPPKQQDAELVPVESLKYRRGAGKPEKSGSMMSKPAAAAKAREMKAIARNPKDMLARSDVALEEVIYAGEYAPDDLVAALKDRNFQVAQRGARVISSLGSFIAKSLLLYSAGNLDASKSELALELKIRLINLGPSFVKFGQALSTRPDLTPPEFIEVLASLQDRLPAFDDELAMGLIEQELGKPVSEIFSEISPEPVAAASLGQVYRGKLLTGEEVAIKVQRPNIVDGIGIDMLLLRRLTQWVDENVNVGPLSTSVLTPLVDEFASRLFGELDYIKEGKSAERFTELYAGKRGLENITAPKIYWEATSKRVLTMEWIDGVKLTQADEIKKMGFEVIDFVNMGVQCTLRQLLEDGFFHADPHPGNLLVTNEGNLVYIDFGMMSTIPEKARYALISHVVHLVNRDYDAMCQDYYALDFVPPEVDTRPIAPALEDFFEDALGYSVSELNFGALIDGLGEVFFEYPFQLPPYYALIIRSLSFLEGLAIQTDPNYKLLAASYPYIAQRLLTDKSPELRASLEELVLQQGVAPDKQRIRWNRFESLLTEGSKSKGFDSDGLWLLLDWLVQDTGKNVRKPATRELVSVADGMALNTLRHTLVNLINKDTADRLAPLETPADVEVYERAERIFKLLGLRPGMDPLSIAGLVQAVLADSIQKDDNKAISGLKFGSADENTIREAAKEPLQTAVRATRKILKSTRTNTERVEKLLREPGGREIITTLVDGLIQRSLARTARTILGLADGASSGGGGPSNSPGGSGKS
eukprot:CAMPEP_0184480298 /NCGR_PEP_ID=MMETSP0113_2-20130426/1791_1 /TAXON_ID=91329 /ORGANISM="Norrisiella sphaerica, Strain BC52" /LENGTH=757 /DNA_ID=CAMNT_0026858683 /DNA_START=345 /DNA_END=2621 /DNA_ORIENTATION=-